MAFVFYAEFLAFMSTLKFPSAFSRAHSHFGTNLFNCFLSTPALLRHYLRTVLAVSPVALHLTGVSALDGFIADLAALFSLGAAGEGRRHGGLATVALQRLVDGDWTGLAQSDVAKQLALVIAASQRFFAGFYAQMHFCRGAAALNIATVQLAGFLLAANFVADKLVGFGLIALNFADVRLAITVLGYELLTNSCLKPADHRLLVSTFQLYLMRSVAAWN